MLDVFFSGDAIWFGVPAVAGTILFAVKLVLLSIGADHGVDVDMPHDLDGGLHADSTGAFTVLSVQSVIGFAMGFGWGGLAALHFTEWGLLPVSTVAIGSGLAMVWVLATMMRTMLELQSSGNVNIGSTIGMQGTVYVGVPQAGGGGQVRLVVDGRQRLFKAVSGGEELPSGTRIQVLSANDDNTLTVVRA